MLFQWFRRKVVLHFNKESRRRFEPCTTTGKIEPYLLTRPETHFHPKITIRIWPETRNNSARPNLNRPEPTLTQINPTQIDPIMMTTTRTDQKSCHINYFLNKFKENIVLKYYIWFSHCQLIIYFTLPSLIYICFIYLRDWKPVRTRPVLIRYDPKYHGPDINPHPNKPNPNVTRTKKLTQLWPDAFDPLAVCHLYLALLEWHIKSIK